MESSIAINSVVRCDGLFCSLVELQHFLPGAIGRSNLSLGGSSKHCLRTPTTSICSVEWGQQGILRNVRDVAPSPSGRAALLVQLVESLNLFSSSCAAALNDKIDVTLKFSETVEDMN